MKLTYIEMQNYQSNGVIKYGLILFNKVFSAFIEEWKNPITNFTNHFIFYTNYIKNIKTFSSTSNPIQ